MTRIKVFRIPLLFSVFMFVFGAVFFIVGVTLLIIALSSGFNTRFPSGDWNSVIYTVQGLLFIIGGFEAVYSRKFFIEWDDEGLRFFLPRAKKVTAIAFNDIVSIRIRLFEIIFVLHQQTLVMKLENLRFEDLKMIKEKFSAMEDMLSKKPT